MHFLKSTTCRRLVSCVLHSSVCGLLLTSAALAAAPRPPNILFILADDMGYGDPRCFNPDSKIPTPNLDHLAGEGMRFTDAHAPGAVCVPSRYGLITGRYPFRNQGFTKPTAGALIEPGRATIATVLHDAGYSTAMIGKWGSCGFTKPSKIKPTRGGPTGQLYNLAGDPDERNNQWATEPRIVSELSALLEKYQRAARSAP